MRKLFHLTQYIRHHSDPYYTPEPDCCHELLGHVPLFADPNFAELTQEKLATIFWFTAEFILCREDGIIRACGAGLLSLFGELEHALSDVPIRLEFEPSKAVEQTYPLSDYQPLYFVADSFRDATAKLREFNKTMKRLFQVRYYPHTRTVEVLDSKDKVQRFAQLITN
ncbi:hypothetical protein GGH98_004335 [Coemansia sp. RSA 454]|nr:hypothetical protein GGH98_004335 [Coemansia sp. RSA 454]